MLTSDLLHLNLYWSAGLCHVYPLQEPFKELIAYIALAIHVRWQFNAGNVGVQTELDSFPDRDQRPHPGLQGRGWLSPWSTRSWTRPA